ncbi:MAG: Smr/MutS family protein, partial [Acidobacteriota bacterium]|nr:Smr/MutS family protein [Acidobacteriota bacterium]
QQRLDALESEQRAVAERERTLAARELSLEQNGEKKYAAKIRELEQRAADLSAKFEKQAQQTIGDLSQKARVKIAKTRREFQEAVESAIDVSAPASPPRPKLTEGARVRLKNIRQPATVRRILSNGLLEVDAGFLRMQVAASDVEEVLPPSGAQAPRSPVAFRQGPSFDGNFREINLIGQRAEEACQQVDKLLDSAALAEVDRIRIIHGHGMGILKRAIAELLARHPHVEKFYVAPPEEGGAGATIVELKT